VSPDVLIGKAMLVFRKENISTACISPFDKTERQTIVYSATNMPIKERGEVSKGR
jgi:hypothetical protein